MAQWHLSALERALLKRGWQIEPLSEATPMRDGVWSLTRGGRQVLLDFNCFDEMGQDITEVEDSYGCDVRGVDGPGLYFYKKSSPKWKEALRAFVVSLDSPHP